MNLYIHFYRENFNQIQQTGKFQFLGQWVRLSPDSTPFIELLVLNKDY